MCLPRGIYLHVTTMKKIVDSNHPLGINAARLLWINPVLFLLCSFLNSSMGYNGRSCISRALCESSQFFQNKPRNMVEELIRIIFTLPAMKTLPFEHPDLIMYSEAHHKGRADKNSRHYCASAFSNCGFSLIALALGEYAIPSKFL